MTGLTPVESATGTAGVLTGGTLLGAGEVLAEGGAIALEVSNPLGWAVLAGTGLYLAWKWYQHANEKADEQGAPAPPAATCDCPTSTPAGPNQQEPDDEAKRADASRGSDGGALTPSPAQDAPTAAQDGPVPPVAALPSNPDDLLQQGWEETTDPRAAANSNRRTFRNTQTGQELEFDKAAPDAPGFRGQDHYHVPNPDATGKRDAYLDQGGNPVPDGSKKSHILPDGH